MVTLVAVGTLLIAGGPSLAVWLGILQRRAHLLVIAILSAYTWCLSITLASVIWLAIPPLKETYPWVLFVAVSTQELSRFGLFSLFRYMNNSPNGVEVFIRSGPENKLLTGMSVGVGFGLMSVLIHFYSVLLSSFSDDTAIYLLTCPINFFVAAASFSLAFSILQILLGMITWPAYSDREGWPYVLIAYLMHVGITELTLINRRKDGCVIGLGLTWGLLFFLFLFTVFVARRRIRHDIR